MMASASIDGVITLWRTTVSYSSIRQFRASTGITAPVFSPDGAILATSHSNGQVTIWDIVSPARSTVIGSDLGYSRSVAFSPDGQTLAIAAVTSSQILLWDLRAGGWRATLPGFAGGVSSLAFSPDGRFLIIAGNDGTLQLRDLLGGRESAIVRGQRARVCSVAFSRDGHLLASCGNDQCVRLWDVATLVGMK